MFGKDISLKNKTLAAACLSLVYVICASVYFLPADIPYKIAFPTVAIAVSSLWLLPWQMSFALVASALGDIRGAAGNMIGQIEFFSIAHLFLILFFVHRWFHERDAFERAGGRHPETRAAALAGYAVLSVCVLAFAIIWIVPETPEGMVRGCAALFCIFGCNDRLECLCRGSAWRKISYHDTLLCCPVDLFPPCCSFRRSQALDVSLMSPALPVLKPLS